MLTQLKYITSIDLLRDIVQQEMNIPDSRIYMYGQPYVIPEDRGLFVIIEYKYSKIYSNRNINPSTTLSVLYQEQNINTQEFLTVMLMSRNWEAYRRKEEVGMALKSFYAQQSQEKYSYKLSVNPQILDATSLEASAMLYRYDLPVVVLSSYQKIKTVDWFNKFSGSVTASGSGVNDIVINFTQT